jgi:branched-chain amino acid transport system substrate-binding protein
MKTKLKFAAAALALASSLAAAQNSSQGVSKTEITLGTIQDLSGPIAGFGKAVRNGMQLRVEELNEQGGLNGRKIRLLVEDSAYDPKKSVLAAQKLVNQDQVFAILGHMGSASNMAALPMQLEKNVINFFPITAAREMYEPPHRLKWAYFATYYDQMRIAAERLVKERNLKKTCVIYQDDEYGLEVLRGTEAGLKKIGLELVEKTSFKRGATDFSSQVAKMKAAGCDFVVMGTIIRETVGTISESRKTGFTPVFIVSAGAYTELIPKLGGKAMDGLYATMTAQHPYLDEASQQIRFWANKYKTRFNEDPSVLAVYGYIAADTFIRAAQKAGPDLTTDSFVKAMNSLTVPRDIFGSAEANYSPTQHLGSPYARLSQLQDGRWKVVSDYVSFNGLKVVTQKDGRVKVVSEFFND